MGRQSRTSVGLMLVLIGVLGESLICGLPMWRETTFKGANIVTAQVVWDGLWLHCSLKSTGQMQCKRHTTSVTMTADFQAGRALMLLSIIAGFLGFMVGLLGGGLANCSNAPPVPSEPPTTTRSQTKMSLLGGALAFLSGILCLTSVSWSAAATLSPCKGKDPLVAPATKREVGSSIYIGWASSLLLLLGSALICFVCGEKQRSPSPYYTDMLYSTDTGYSTPSFGLTDEWSEPGQHEYYSPQSRTERDRAPHLLQPMVVFKNFLI